MSAAIRVEDLGGLSQGAIEARILLANEGTRAMLKEHSEEINKRFDKRDEMVDKRFDTVEDALKSLASSQAEVGKQLALTSQAVTSYVSRGDEWHREDIAYREKLARELADSTKLLAKQADETKDLKTEVASIRKHQEEAKKSLQRLGWLFDVLKVFTSVAKAAVGKSEEVEGKKKPTLIAAISSTLVLLWILLHQIVPKIHYYLFEGHKFTWWSF